MTDTAGNTDPLQAEDSEQATAEPALPNFLQGQLDRRAESVEAFNKDATEEPSMRDLLEEQVKLLRQVRGLKDRMVRVQQGLLVSQFLSVLVAGGIVALASFFYFNPNFAGRRGGGSEYGGFSGQQAMGLGQVDLDQSGNEFSGMAVTAEKDTSGLKYRKMIESFLLRADRLTVDPTHAVDRRVHRNEACI
ncbi:MAG: hypothetical protein OSA98_03070 [Rubripirellula sp.]|nr:hypothetical protein [Rubripirellula sp.]